MINTNNITANINNYLTRGKVLQVATSRDGRPWVVNVFFVVDEELNFFWLSLPSRRHSQDIAANPRAAATLAVKQDLPVIGVYAEGAVEVAKDQTEVKKIAEAYSQKYNAAKGFYERFVSGTNQHWVYKLRPDTIKLFDELHYLDDPEQSVAIRD